MKYVSFSLWGDNPLYNIGAIKNSELMSKIYPDWKMIVYYDNSVPTTTITELEKNNVVLKKIEDCEWNMKISFEGVKQDMYSYLPISPVRILTNKNHPTHQLSMPKTMQRKYRPFQ